MRVVAIEPIATVSRAKSWQQRSYWVELYSSLMAATKQMSLVKTINFPPLGDERGSLVALEANKTVPFDVKRVYFIFGTQLGVARGFHAHRALQQVAVCVTGRCRIVLDDGMRREDVWLDSPTKGLLIGDLVWREMHNFSADCVLLVLASEHYNEADYIRDYEEFKRVSKS